MSPTYQFTKTCEIPSMFPILPPSPPSHHIPNKMPVFVGEVQRTL